MATILQQVLGQCAEARAAARAERVVLRLKQKKLDEQIEKGKRELARRRKQLGEAIETFVKANGIRLGMDRHGASGDHWACQLIFDARFVKHMFSWGTEEGVWELCEIIVRHLAPQMAEAMMGYNRTRRIVDVKGPSMYALNGEF